ncbi:MAG TPA: winged helix-turn-helix transcriptional regulator [Solirubrobacterales bacterium]
MVRSAIGGADRARAGSRVLGLLSDALNASILRALLRGPLPVSELACHLSPTSRTTRFGRLRELEDLGVIAREKRPGTPPVSYCSLAPAGRSLLPVVGRFAEWLASDPSGPSSPDDLTGARKIKALANAWDTTVLRWLAERPCSLTELDSLSPSAVSHHEARKSREGLSAAGLIAPVESRDRRRPYAPVSWARCVAGCIAAAIGWELAFLEASAFPSSVDVETLLLLLLPLVDSIPVPHGSVCALQVDQSGDLPVATVEEGRIVPGATDVDSGNGRASRISGSAESWLHAIVHGRTESLSMQGRTRLTTALVSGIHAAGMRHASEPGADTLDKLPISLCAI